MCTCAHPFFLFVYGVDFSFASLANENCLTFVFIFSFYYIPLQCNLISTYFLWNFSIKYYNSFLSPKNKKKGILPQSKHREKKTRKKRKENKSFIPFEELEKPRHTHFSHHPVFLTFYRLGPEFITWSYPVDTTPIEELFRADVLIEDRKYKHDDDFVANLKEYDNDKLMTLSPELLDELKVDLEFLAEHGFPGAYTLLGSLQNNFTIMMDYFRKAVDNNIKEGLVSYGMRLCLENEIEKGLPYLERGAEMGENVGLMIMGVSYNFGTLTQIDLQKASYYYRRAIKENNNYYACVNLGALYVSANYFHTAAYFFNKAKEIYTSDPETRDQVNYFGGEKYLDNAQKAETMLQLPIQERIRRSVVQYHSPELHPIFVNQINPPKPVVSESKQPNVAWQPDDPSEILQADIEEHNSSALLVAQKPEVKFPFDDFVFPVLNIKMKNPKYLGLQREIIFLERNVHYELNQYIQQNLGKIRSQFRKYGFYFVYMPAHTKSQQDEVDLIYPLADTFREDSDFRLGWANGLTWNERRERDESLYWKGIRHRQLPRDCAGFLHFVPNPENEPLYQYILFPTQPGTNWDKAFASLIDFVSRLPIVNTSIKKKLPLNTKLLIDEQYRIFLYDDVDDQKITEEIKMPTLSKALYFVLLKHEEGATIKCLVDYEDELLKFYMAMTNRKAAQDNVSKLIDPTNNSANEKLSRIKRAFTEALQDYDIPVEQYSPTGNKGEAYVVAIDRASIIWQPKEIDLF